MTLKCPRPWSSRLASVATFGLLALLGVSAAQAQNLVIDPYRPYTAGYEAYTLPPTASSNFNALNSTRARSYSSRANELSSFYDELYGPPGEEATGTPRRLVGPGVPYSAANRQYDELYGRVYQPNKNDAEFYKDQQKRTRDYFEALKEHDPKKRAEKLRAVEIENLRAARSLSMSQRRTVAAPSAVRAPAAPATPGAPSAGAARPRAGQGAAVRPRGTQPTTTAPLTRTPIGRAAPAPPNRALTPGSAAPARRTPAQGLAPAPSAPPGTERPSDILDRALRSEPSATPDEPSLDPLPPRTRRANPPPR